MESERFMPNLTFNQRTVVDLYPQFYGNSYPEQLHQEDVTRVHINAQKMCYLLKKVGIDVGNYGYSWNFHGPFSPGLLVLLHSLDSQEEDVQYYCDNPEHPATFSDDEQEKVTSLIQNLHLAEHENDRSSWMELLGSLVFLSHSVLPGEDFANVVQELKSRKPQFSNDNENREAWDVLKTANLLRVCS
jgi:hypothetical protein